MTGPAIPRPRPVPPVETPARARRWTREMAAEQRAATARACAMLVQVTGYRDLVEIEAQLAVAAAQVEHEQAKATAAETIAREAEQARGAAEAERDVARRERDVARERLELARQHFRHVQGLLLADEDRAEAATGSLDMRSAS